MRVKFEAGLVLIIETKILYYTKKMRFAISEARKSVNTFVKGVFVNTLGVNTSEHGLYNFPIQFKNFVIYSNQYGKS